MRDPDKFPRFPVVDGPFHAKIDLSNTGTFDLIAADPDVGYVVTSYVITGDDDATNPTITWKDGGVAISGISVIGPVVPRKHRNYDDGVLRASKGNALQATITTAGTPATVVAVGHLTYWKVP